jgi:hypothetical protein
LLIVQMSQHTRQERAPIGHAHIKHSCNGTQNLLRLMNGCQGYKTDAVGEGVNYLSSHLQSQVSLAYTRRAQQRKQAHLGTLQQTTECGQLLLPTQEWCWRER